MRGAGEGVLARPSRWLEVTFAAPTATAMELGSGALFEVGATGLEELTPLEDGRLRARAFFRAEAIPLDATPLARLGCAVLGSRTLADEAWEQSWRAGLVPIALGTRLVVVPSGCEAPADRTALRIDPGSAFGTGLHTSTALAAGLLEQVLDELPAPASVLDVGTGSGILAIAAYRLGARPVLAIDNDPYAVDEAEANAKKNGCRDAFEASDRPLEAIEARFDVVVANLDARALGEHGAGVAARVAPGGRLVVAGLREDERWPTPGGIREVETVTTDGWRAELWAKPPD